MNDAHELTIIGRAERLDILSAEALSIPARIDTGAKTSALWVSDIKEENGVLSYVLFDKTSEFYTGVRLQTSNFSRRVVANSTGHMQERYAVRHTVRLAGRRIKATFTLANRAGQVYPVLVGRNILRGKFIVNVKLGEPLLAEEHAKEDRKKQFMQQLSPSKENS